MELTLGEIAVATHGSVRGDSECVVSGFSNDSRAVQVGECFVAIIGERDGHKFIRDAITRGAAAAVVSHDDQGALACDNAVVVQDTLVALLDLARWVRMDRLRAARVVGITGSTGKTSTKDFLASALSQALSSHANIDSFNNEIGLPMTLLSAPADVEVVVCEMGARFAGNIAKLCEIAKPNIGVITNIGSAHGEHLGGSEGIARVKGELLDALGVEGLAILCYDDPSTARLRRRTTAHVLTAGTTTNADIQVKLLALGSDLKARIALSTDWGNFETELGIRGAHQITNAALAATVALFLGAEPSAVAEGLAAARGSSWRMDLARTVKGITVLNDSYNANPHSMRAALQGLAGVGGARRRVAVLGAMREIGASSVDDHAVIGAMAADCGVAKIIAVGSGPDMDALASAAMARDVEVVRVVDAQAALGSLDGLDDHDVVLVKASRVIGLEVVAQALIDLNGGTR